MILVGQFDSPFVRRVAVTLHHYRMPFTRNPISVFRNIPEMRKINPLVRVPSLILETGETLIDSSAIIDYLDEKAGPALSLTPARGAERRKVLQATALALGTMDKTLVLFYERLFHSGTHINRDYEMRLTSQIGAGLAQLEHDCGAPWFFGHKMTQADVIIGCSLAYMALRLPDVFPAEPFPRLQALAQHCESTDDFVKARPSPQESAPANIR
jgi:glutathione S-transferase